MIIITLYTYCPESVPERKRYAFSTLQNFFRNIITKRQLWLHIADDGSSQEYRDYLWELAYTYCGSNRSITNSEHHGYGSSYNKASYITHNLENVEALIHLEDDWLLTNQLDLDVLVEDLYTDNRFNCIRLGRFGYTRPANAEICWINEKYYLLFDPYSPSEYIFSGGPRIEKLSYSRSIGLWTENLTAGETELDVCNRLNSRIGVLWPIELTSLKGDLFRHIGEVQVKNLL